MDAAHKATDVTHRLVHERWLNLGFTVEGLEDLWGPMASRALQREEPWLARLAIREYRDDPRARLAALFILGLSQPRDAINGLLGSEGLQHLHDIGLLTSDGAGDDARVTATCDVRPYSFVDDRGSDQWWIASDKSELSTGAPLPENYVLGVGGATLTLVSATARTAVDRVLDLGTGCGIQAMHATRHAAHVVGTDISARALWFAEVNTAMNGLSNLDWRQGNLFEPVADEEFDLIVSNPPFVISPVMPDEARHTYRDGGFVGDELTAAMIRKIPPRLKPGGIAQLLGNWEHREGQDWHDRVNQWLEAAGIDAWVVQRDVQDPAQYIETWLRDSGHLRGDSIEQMVEHWMNDFKSRGVRAIGFGHITLHRPQQYGAPSIRVESVTSGSVTGQSVSQYWTSVEWRRQGGNLLNARLRVADDITEERYLRPGAVDPQVILLQQGGALARSRQLTTAEAAVIGACDGELSVQQLIQAVAHLLDVAAVDLAAEVLPTLDDLLTFGVLHIATE